MIWKVRLTNCNICNIFRILKIALLFFPALPSFSWSRYSFDNENDGWGDVVITEIMADPTPPVMLNGEEYVELFNRSAFAVPMKEWRLEVNGRSRPVPDTLLDPGAFLLVKGVPLPNEGAVVILRNGAGKTVHVVSYRIPWDGAEWKKEGGWALEYPDPDRVCCDPDLWTYSLDPGGGTPGRVNSCFGPVPDLEPPICLYAGLAVSGEAPFGSLNSVAVICTGEAPSALTFSGDKPAAPLNSGASFCTGVAQGDRTTGPVVTLHYSEPVSISRDAMERVRLDPGGWQPDSAWPADPLATCWSLQFTGELQEGTTYRLSLPAVEDCARNSSAGGQKKIGLAEGAAEGGLLINEIMFDPAPGSPEYVEIWHRGERVTDLRYYALMLTGEKSSQGKPVPLSGHSRLVEPGEYMVLTSCVPAFVTAYNLERSGCWVEVPGWERLANSGGRIYLTDRAGMMLDAALYRKEMHLDLLRETGGVSLERISPDRSGTDVENWHSAASLEGYATPGRRNSQFLEAGEGDEWLTIEPRVFSPDNDGHKDLLEVTLHPGRTGWVVSIIITDLKGYRIRILANNHLIGPSSTYLWNGEDGSGCQCAEGFYLITVLGYHDASENRKRLTRSVALIYR